VFDQICIQISRGKPVNAQLLPRSVHVLRRCGELADRAVDDLAELFGHRGGVGLVEDRAHQGRDPRLRRFRHLGEQVAQVVGVAPLPASAR
jgi:hypothetical protein